MTLEHNMDSSSMSDDSNHGDDEVSYDFSFYKGWVRGSLPL